ncbi:MAG TPA: ABC transporter ATP-binding protein [Allosphingosinicella sp.]|nr:ABC transporter ATP-binding protein [Allosphingosinicella sp.]
MIELANLSKIYRAGEVETQALAGLTLGIAPGEFVAVTGPSGCGKSSLLNILGFLDAPSGGSYRLLGEEARTEQDRTRLRRAHVGFIFQSFNLIDELSVAENIEISLLYRTGGGRSPRRRVAAVMEEVGIAHRAGHLPRTLSGGQQQRVAIARALVSQPRLILADEPTGNLDSAHGAAVIEILRAAAGAGTTIVMVTHSPLHAAAADRRIELLDGKLVGEGAG